MGRDNKEQKLEEARLLMPWYLTGRLSNEEHAFVESALEEYPELQQEFTQENQMMALVRDNSQLLELSTLDSTEKRLDQLMKRIDREEDQQAPKVEPKPQTTIEPKVSATTNISNWFKDLFGSQWFTPANAVFATLLLFQLGFVGVYLKQTDSANAEEAVYTSASVSPDTSANKANTQQPLLMIEFQQDAQHGQVCSFLSRHQAEIIEGPNAYNIFTIKMAGLSSMKEVEAAIKKMNAETDAPVVFVGKKFTE